MIRVLRRHIFKSNWRKLIVSEALWVSGKKHESGYRKSHAENGGKSIILRIGNSPEAISIGPVLTISGAEQLGKIMVDLTQLRAHPDRYLRTEENSDRNVHTFWEIEFELCLMIDGRNLSFDARSPENPEQVTSSRNFSIAASFVPGTA